MWRATELTKNVPGFHRLMTRNPDLTDGTDVARYSMLVDILNSLAEIHYHAEDEERQLSHDLNSTPAFSESQVESRKATITQDALLHFDLVKRKVILRKSEQLRNDGTSHLLLPTQWQ